MKFAKCPAMPYGLLAVSSYAYQNYCQTHSYTLKCKICHQGEIVEVDCPMLQRCIGTEEMDCKNRDFFECDWFQTLHGEKLFPRLLLEKGVSKL